MTVRIFYREPHVRNMDISDVSRSTGSGLELDLTVSPRSSRSGAEGIDPWRKRLIIRVKAPPLDGRANKEVEDVLRDITGCKTQVVSGQTSRQKTVLIAGDPKEICARLAAHI